MAAVLLILRTISRASDLPDLLRRLAHRERTCASGAHIAKADQRQFLDPADSFLPFVRPQVRALSRERLRVDARGNQQPARRSRRVGDIALGRTELIQWRQPRTRGRRRGLRSACTRRRGLEQAGPDWVLLRPNDSTRPVEQATTQSCGRGCARSRESDRGRGAVVPHDQRKQRDATKRFALSKLSTT